MLISGKSKASLLAHFYLALCIALPSARLVDYGVPLESQAVIRIIETCDYLKANNQTVWSRSLCCC